MYIWEVAAFPSWESYHFGKCTFGKLPLFLHGEVTTREIVNWETVHLESLRLGNYTFGKLSL